MSEPAPVHPDPAMEARKQAARTWFEALRDRLCAALEALEDAAAKQSGAPTSPARFERRPWRRPGDRKSTRLNSSHYS